MIENHQFATAPFLLKKFKEKISFFLLFLFNKISFRGTIDSIKT